MDRPISLGFPTGELGLSAKEGKVTVEVRQGWIAGAFLGRSNPKGPGMEATLEEIASWVQGKVQEPGAGLFSGARTLDRAGPSDISFIENAKALRHAEKSLAGALIVPEGTQVPGRPTIHVRDSLASFTEVVKRFRGLQEKRTPGIHPSAVIHPSARLGQHCEIHPFAVVGENAVLGDDCVLHPHAVVGAHCHLGQGVVLHPGVILYPRTQLGNRVTIHAHSVIGADGFGYRQEKGVHQKVQQLGVVVIEDDVEIGACTTIDRATFEETRIGKGSKIDNLVQIGHNCVLGPGNLIVSQAGIAGSTTTGSHVVIAGQAGLADHLHIGNQVVIGARSGVMRDVPDGEHILGAPARPEQEFKRMIICLERLPDLIKQVRALAKQAGLTESAG